MGRSAQGGTGRNPPKPAVLATLDAEIVATERLNHGVIERVHARKPLS